MLYTWKALQSLRTIQHSVPNSSQEPMREYLRKFGDAHERAYMYGASLRKEGNSVFPEEKVEQFINNKILEPLMGLEGYIKPDNVHYTRELIALIVEDDRNDYRESAAAGFRATCPEADVRNRLGVVMEALALAMCPDSGGIQQRREQVHNNR